MKDCEDIICKSLTLLLLSKSLLSTYFWEVKLGQGSVQNVLGAGKHYFRRTNIDQIPEENTIGIGTENE